MRNLRCCPVSVFAGRESRLEEDNNSSWVQNRRERWRDYDIAMVERLKRCRDLDEGKELHAQIRSNRRDQLTVLGNGLLKMYAKCGSLEDARQVFNRIQVKNKISWTVMLAAYVDNGKDSEAIKLFQYMDFEGVEADMFIFCKVINACSNLEDLQKGCVIHARLIAQGYQPDLPLNNALITMYGKCGCVDVSTEIFNNMAAKDLISWNALILSNTQNRREAEASQIYLRMNLEGVQPDVNTFIAMAAAFGELRAISQGRQIHARAVAAGYQSSSIVQNVLIHMYAKLDCLDDARSVFDSMENRTSWSWHTILAAYVQNGQGVEALKLFRYMDLEGVDLSVVTFSILTSACSTERDLSIGKALHARISAAGLDETHPFLASGLVNMYAKCGSLQEAESMFNKLASDDPATWSAIISAYVDKQQFSEALNRYYRSRLEGVTPTDAAFASVLTAYSALGQLSSSSTAVIAEIFARGCESNILVGNKLLVMFAKCGWLDEFTSVFERMKSKCNQNKLMVWNSAITAFGKHGYGNKSLDLFRLMNLEYLAPDDVTFSCLLQACSHSGLLADGLSCFLALSQDYGLEPSLDHYCCLIDLLGRAGMVAEAADLIQNMPYEPDNVAVNTVLAACTTHADVDAAKRVAEVHNVVNSEILLANMYANAAR